MQPLSGNVARHNLEFRQASVKFSWMEKAKSNSDLQKLPAGISAPNGEGKG
jgi:hypothetical protein